MKSGYEFADDARGSAERLLHHHQEVLGFAVSVISPNNPNADPIDVFPAPGQYPEGEGPELTSGQEIKLRGLIHEFGFSRESDMKLSTQSGMRGAHVVIEAGPIHKVIAETQIVLEDAAAMPSSLIFTGSPNRKITNVEESVFTQNYLGAPKKNEYEMVEAYIRQLPGFQAIYPSDRGYSYDIHNSYAVEEEELGQFMLLGFIEKVPVVLMRLDDINEKYIEGGKIKTRQQQIGAAALLRVVEEVASLQGDERWPIALATSSTYQPSREVDAALVSLETQRRVGIASYGTARLAAVKHEFLSETPASELTVELHQMAQATRRLENFLKNRR